MTVFPSSSYNSVFSFCSTLAFPNMLKINPYDVVYLNVALSELVTVGKRNGVIYAGEAFFQLPAAFQCAVEEEINNAKDEYNKLVIHTPTQKIVLRISEPVENGTGTVIFYNTGFFDELPNNVYDKDMAIVLINEGFVFQCTKFDGVPTALKLMQYSTNLAKPDKLKGEYITRIGIDVLIALSDLSGKAKEITFDVGYEYERVVKPTVKAIPSYSDDRLAAFRADIPKILQVSPIKRTVLLDTLAGKHCTAWEVGDVLCTGTDWIIRACVVYVPELLKKELQIYYVDRGTANMTSLRTRFLRANRLIAEDVLFVKI
jgi:hypothetical protein